MKKNILFVGLFTMLFSGWTWSAVAQKKYRYIKREHGAHFYGNIPMKIGGGKGFNVDAQLEGAYSYNWKGIVEAGPYFGLSLKFASANTTAKFQLPKWAGGIFGEYNIIKNRGKRKIIPAIGLKVGVAGGEGNKIANLPATVTSNLNLAVSPYGAVKFFVGKRTPFKVMLGYELQTNVRSFFRPMSHGVNLSMGFAYYFDVY